MTESCFPGRARVAPRLRGTLGVAGLAVSVVSLVACTGSVGDFLTGAENEGGGSRASNHSSGAGAGAGGASSTPNGGAAGLGPGNGAAAGNTGTAGTSGAAGNPTVEPNNAPMVQLRLPRLSHRQWTNTVKTFLRLDTLPAEVGTLRPDSALPDAFENDERNRSVDGTLVSNYRSAADVLADFVVDDTDALARLLADGGTGDATTRLRALITAAWPRAYRRALTTAEIDRYVDLGQKAPGYAAADNDDARLRAALRLLLRLTLQSPHFVYRVELGRPETDHVVGSFRVRTLTNDEYAARLSYALFDAPPDAALRAMDLGDAAVRKSAIASMLADARVNERLQAFHENYYLVTEARGMRKDVGKYPDSKDLGTDAAEEASRFLSDVVQSGGTVRDLFLSRKTFVNKRLAVVYGLSTDGLTDGAFDPRELPANRGGILTRVSFMGVEADLVERSTIHRGVFLQRKILCGKLDNPPKDAVSKAPKPPPSLLTNRERVSYITSVEDTCRGCHEKIINPLGFAFEQFDAIGKFVDTENGQPVDSSSTVIIDGTKRDITGARQFVEEAAESSDAHRCYAENLATWMLGRPVEAFDKTFTAQAGARSKTEQLPLKEILNDVVTSESFASLLEEIP
jgi:hypothetical protein